MNFREITIYNNIIDDFSFLSVVKEKFVLILNNISDNEYSSLIINNIEYEFEKNIQIGISEWQLKKNIFEEI